MASEPVVPYTVVIPAYNAAAWIAEAVCSAADQEPRPAEIIVVDDGSTDDTGPIAAGLPGVRVVHRENGGEAAARNTGLRAATTRWVSFLDADDVYLPHRQRRVMAHLAAHPDHLVVAADALVEVGGAYSHHLYSPHDSEFAHTDQRGAILDRNFLMSHVMCDRERLLGLGGFDEDLRHACDWDMWIRFVLDGGTIGLIDVPLSRYRLHGASLTSDPVRVVRGDIAVWTKARSLPQLTPDERSRISDHLHGAHNRLERELMKRSVRLGTGDARRLALAVMRSPLQSMPARIKAMAVFLAPGLLRRLDRAAAARRRR
jgi:glycosyltransferase involved in cell wall biosynthesis